MKNDELTGIAYDFLMTARGENTLVEGYRNASLEAFFDDLCQLSETDARNVLLTMMGYISKIPPKEYRKIQERGWVFPTDFDVENPNQYGYDEEGRSLSGNLAVSPNGTGSVSIFDVTKYADSQDLYRSFFKRLFQR